MSKTPDPPPSAGAARAAAILFAEDPMWFTEAETSEIIDRETGAELAQIKSILADPNSVRINMLRGTIAWTPQALRSVLGQEDQPTNNMTEIQQLIDNVRAWGIAKGITGPDGKATLLSQLSKTQEELTETRDAAVLYAEQGRGTRDIADGIGDTCVTLILAAELAGLRFEDCLQAAYDEIKGRTGRMVDGVFVKDKP